MIITLRSSDRFHVNASAEEVCQYTRQPLCLPITTMDSTGLYLLTNADPAWNPHIYLVAVILLTLCIYLVHRDFCAFKALGPGGTPSNFAGYVKIKLLSIFAIANPILPVEVPSSMQPQTGYLRHLPPRFGPRPTVEGIAPHRQTSQRPSPAAFNRLVQTVHEFADQHPASLKLGTSCLEKHGPGLFTLCPTPAVISRTGARNCSGEICHSHPSDGSTHLTLHPADAAILLEAGWGERHPLAKGGWLSRFVPGGFVMVYAPRDEAEMEVVKKVMEAAIWWVGGLDVSCS